MFIFGSLIILINKVMRNYFNNSQFKRYCSVLVVILISNFGKAQKLKYTDSMSVARSWHASALLPNGQILVSGGVGAGNTLKSCELYDPSNGKWSKTGSMNYSRSTHQLIILQNGKAISIGGAFYDSSCEYYDYSKGTWSITGSLNANRDWHTATLLKNGKILITGGENMTGALNSCEIFDPATSTWSKITSMNCRRFDHTATLLRDGKVLVCGGYTNNTMKSLRSCEIYDPVKNSWSFTDSLNISRSAHSTALLLNGCVMVIGGTENSYEIYNLSTGKWGNKEFLSTGYHNDYSTATVLKNGKVILAGSDFNCQLYDTILKKWRVVDSINKIRQMHTSELLPNGEVIIIGGQTSANNAFRSCEIYCDCSFIKVDNSNSIIPPWQRKGDDFQGSIEVDLTLAGSNPKWHIEADAFDANNNYVGHIDIGSGTTKTIISFKSDDVKKYLIEGYYFTWNAVLEGYNHVSTAKQTTNIIEKKWDYKNLVLLNDAKASINIPIKYDPNNPAKYIRIYRAGSVAFKLSLKSPIPGTIITNIFSPITGTYSLDFKVESTGFCNVDLSNSNLRDVLPGDFFIQVFSNGTIPDEYMFFDLTKIGKVFSKRPSQEKIIVMVGGIYNEMESSVASLNTSTNIEDETYSILDELEKIGFSTWYIAQGNANSIVRNGYDVGIALDEIEKNNPGMKEINIVAHSKGGLDVRAAISGLTEAYNKSSAGWDFQKSKVKDKLKKVLFLGTPHNGANLAAGLLPISSFLQHPGAVELSNLAGVIDILNSFKLPQNIWYANLAGYKSSYGFLQSNSSRPIYLSKLTPVYYNNLSDGIVKVSSNYFFYKKYNSSNNIIQMYQNGDWSSIKFWDNGHFQVHKIDFLTQKEKYHNAVNCLTKYPNNVKKILNFFLDPSALDNCPNPPNQTPIKLTLVASIIPGAKIFIKPQSDSSYYFLGLTNEKSTFSENLVPSLEIGDSIIIIASGYERLSISIDSTILKNSNMEVGMVELTSKVKSIMSPVLILENNTNIVTDSIITLEAFGKNVVQFEINANFHQDSLFIPLNLTNNQFKISLDTGSNIILVRFIGIEDTVVISKIIYYLPHSLKSKLSYQVILNTDSLVLGAELYINNQFIKTIDKIKDSTIVMNGENYFSFRKVGFQDSVVFIDSTASISVSKYLFKKDVSYSFDSTIIDFTKYGKIHYRRNTTLMDSSMQSIISFKQYIENSNNKGLIPKSRKFEFKNLNIGWSKIKFYSILGQSDLISKNSTYLLRIMDDSIFTKFYYDSIHSNYDSIFQRLTFNSIDFNNGKSKKEALVVVQKQSPVVIQTNSLTISESDSLKLPLSEFFLDPDSINNDITYELVDSNLHGFSIKLAGVYLAVKANQCYHGKDSFTIKAIHDGLSAINSQKIIINSIDTSINWDGTELSSKQASASYRWLNCTTMDTIPGEKNQYFKPTINGNYAVIISKNNCIDTSTCYSISTLKVTTENYLNKNFSISPNPYDDFIIIRGFSVPNETFKIKLINLWGQEIAEQEIIANGNSFETQLKTNGFNRGMYFLTISSNGTKLVFKVLKK